MSWYWEILLEQDIVLDSSVFPISTPFYGMPAAERYPYEQECSAGSVTIVPISTMRMFGFNFPFSGGFYFRFLPYFFIQSAIRKLNRSGHPIIFYCHPWEFDPDHPQPNCVTLRERLSHYGFLKGNQEKFETLLNEFEFGPISKVLARKTNNK
jgi:hypothetical protein